ncbi:kinase-like protein, partial [Byssothecium circinans]
MVLRDAPNLREAYMQSRLKRSKTSIGDLERLDADLSGSGHQVSPPPAAKPIAGRRARPSRGLSFTKLTNSLGFSTSRKQGIDKSTISRPIIDPNNPIILPPGCLDLGAVSPPPSTPLLSSYTSPDRKHLLPRESLRISSTGHLHSVSEPVTFPSNFPYPPPSRPPPPIPHAPSIDRRDSVAEPPLKSIVESPSESEVASDHGKLNCDTLDRRLRKLADMDPSRLSLQPPATATKARAIQQAKDMQNLVAERVRRSGEEAPPYDFYELIGKGTYGRVFKGLNRKTGGLVAIKIIDIDKEDYEQMTTTGLSDTLREINVLQQVGDSRARPYVNIIEEARPVHSELWIVSEYASGGSVSTLMKPTLGTKIPGLDEKFIIPIARELALGLKYIHEAGVLHRDLKCNNVLILEDGRVQLCDFGVSGMLEPAKSKRSTIVGTPYWMAPELQREYVKAEESRSMDTNTDLLYGSEVDIWAYGCTVYEMATGSPPHSRVQAFDLPNAGVPVLEGDEFSQDLKDFLAFVFQPEPENRPTPDEILEHPYLANSTKMYPTVMLVKLVEDYYKWEQEGGSRVSLFNPYGAQAPEALAEADEDDDDWTFSTSDEFENRLSRAFPDPFTAPGQTYNGMTVPSENDDRWEKMKAAWHEESISRGAKKLNRLFDPNSTPYRYSALDEGGNGRPPSDLILRDFNPGAPNRETVIDLDFAAPMTSDVPNIDLDEVPTLKANRMQKLLRDTQMEDEEQDTFDMDNIEKRATMDWKFSIGDDQDQTAKRATQDWKFP